MMLLKPFVGVLFVTQVMSVRDQQFFIVENCPTVLFCFGFLCTKAPYFRWLHLFFEPRFLFALVREMIIRRNFFGILLALLLYVQRLQGKAKVFLFSQFFFCQCMHFLSSDDWAESGAHYTNNPIWWTLQIFLPLILTLWITCMFRKTDHSEQEQECFICSPCNIKKGDILSVCN